MSLSTTIYLRWVEAAYDRVFSENLTSIRVLNSLESGIWKTMAEWNDASLDADQLSLRRADTERSLFELCDSLLLTIQTPNERLAEERLRGSVTSICQAMETEVNISRTTQERRRDSTQRLYPLAADLAANSATLKEMNERLIASARSRLANTQAAVLVSRTLILLLGLPTGLYLGWRVARKLQTSVSEIAVTLNNTASIDGTPEMKVSITKNSTIEDVQRQAEVVVERLRSAGLELQSARREVIQAERLAAVGELAAGVAHELRNPLTSVKLLLQHAVRQPASAKINAAQWQLILDEVGRMETTIQGLLDFSRTPTLNRIRHDLRETLKRSLNLTDGRIQQAHIQLISSIAKEPLWVDGDPEQLNQVFVNLLLNSIEAMESGGRLEIDAQCSVAQSTIRVSVTDSGSGIASEVLERLFEPFATTKERGTGLGLAISRRIVSEHAGTIHAKNKPDRGAVFTVELPLCLLDTP